MNSHRSGRTRNEEYKTWGVIPQQTHKMLTDLTSGEANDIVADTRKNTLESSPRLRKRPDSTAGGRKRNLLRTIVSPERCSLLELQAGMERWESAVSQYEENLKNKMNDEIKLAGLEALVPKELEKHLILNSSCFRTIEDARREVVTYHAARNKFERFRGFWELISRFEFEFCRCGNFFFERFEFLVC